MQLDTVKQQKNLGGVDKQVEMERVMESLTQFLAEKSGEELVNNLEKQLTAYRALRQGKCIYSYSFCRFIRNSRT